MKLICDFHLHSKYSRATSKVTDLENIYKYSKIKGINVIATGDFTHPKWIQEIQENLIESEPGLFEYKKSKQIKRELPQSIRNNLTRFILSSEISTIYTNKGKVRKVHHLILAPNIKTVLKLNRKLSKIGNIHSDGRPILGISSKDLLKLCLDTDSRLIYIPAHIWTPWFSIFGSKSGYNSFEEAYDELAGEIKIIETGLSSDPFMNWRVKQIQPKTIISNSDAHSVRNLGREANLLDTDLNYDSIRSALLTNDKRVIGTIEFYPDEGKYHLDGHRNCNVSFTPEETKKLKGICPVCKKPLVIGVLNRVHELADFSPTYKPKNHKEVKYIIPLAEMIAEIKGIKSSHSKNVEAEYFRLINDFGSEFEILINLDTKKLKEKGYDEIAQSIEKMRKGEVYIKPGYDGEYGKISVFNYSKEKSSVQPQLI